jgi:hypothetical protein
LGGGEGPRFIQDPGRVGVIGVLPQIPCLGPTLHHLYETRKGMPRSQLRCFTL